jgi:hypothetical protein
VAAADVQQQGAVAPADDAARGEHALGVAAPAREAG